MYRTSHEAAPAVPAIRYDVEAHSVDYRHALEVLSAYWFGGLSFNQLPSELIESELALNEIFCPCVVRVTIDGRVQPHVDPTPARGAPRRSPQGDRNRVLFGMDPRAEAPKVGEKIALRRNAERFPHFIAPMGATGTVTEVNDLLVAVKMDKTIDGAGDWDNEVHWNGTDFVTDYRDDTAPAGRKVFVRVIITEKDGPVESEAVFAMDADAAAEASGEDTLAMCVRDIVEFWVDVASKEP